MLKFCVNNNNMKLKLFGQKRLDVMICVLLLIGTLYEIYVVIRDGFTKINLFLSVLLESNAFEPDLAVVTTGGKVRSCGVSGEDRVLYLIRFTLITGGCTILYGAWKFAWWIGGKVYGGGAGAKVAKLVSNVDITQMPQNIVLSRKKFLFGPTDYTLYIYAKPGSKKFIPSNGNIYDPFWGIPRTEGGKNIWISKSGIKFETVPSIDRSRADPNSRYYLKRNLPKPPHLVREAQVDAVDPTSYARLFGYDTWTELYCNSPVVDKILVGLIIWSASVVGLYFVGYVVGSVRGRSTLEYVKTYSDVTPMYDIKLSGFSFTDYGFSDFTSFIVVTIIVVLSRYFYKLRKGGGFASAYAYFCEDGVTYEDEIRNGTYKRGRSGLGGSGEVESIKIFGWCFVTGVLVVTVYYIYILYRSNSGTSLSKWEKVGDYVSLRDNNMNGGKIQIIDAWTDAVDTVRLGALIGVVIGFFLFSFCRLNRFSFFKTMVSNFDQECIVEGNLQVMGLISGTSRVDYFMCIFRCFTFIFIKQSCKICIEDLLLDIKNSIIAEGKIVEDDEELKGWYMENGVLVYTFPVCSVVYVSFFFDFFYEKKNFFSMQTFRALMSHFYIKKNMF